MPFDREEIDDRAGFSRRSFLVGAAQIGLFGVVGARLYGLQVVDSRRYSLLADQNRISVRIVPPVRGEVRDRFGAVVATNEPRLTAFVIPEQAGDLTTVLDRVSRIVTVTDERRQEIIEAARRQRSFLPITISDELDWEEFASLNYYTMHLPGIATEVGWRRRYPMGPVFGHYAGYVAVASESEAGEERLLKMPGFTIGKFGVEKAADLELRGTPGSVTLEIEASGRIARELERQAAQPGRELILTADGELQTFVMEQMKDKVGGVVVMDVNNGDVLAMVSSPGFDPSVFEDGLSEAEWRVLNRRDGGAMLNRAVAGQYPPGSTFKVATSLAALETKGFNPFETVQCLGGMYFGGRRFRCWKAGGHGHVNMHDAMKGSCDVYFYTMGNRIGIDAIAKAARQLGLGETYDFVGAKAGVVADTQWKRSRLGKPWYGGETLNASIGQGYMLATPLQLAVMAARVANGRFKVMPRFVRPAGADAPAPEFERLGVPLPDISRMHAAMNAVVNGEGGTARASRIDVEGVLMAGKTGTSQVISASKVEEGNESHEDHALFIAFAPVVNPAYAISVVVEHGGGGSRTAAPIAKVIMEHLFERQLLARTPYDGVEAPRAEPAPSGQPETARG